MNEVPTVPVHTDTLPQLRGLLEVTRLVRARAELPELFAAIARTISEAFGFRTVAINSYRPAWDDFEVVTVHGSPAAREALLGQTTDRESWEPYFDGRYERRGCYLILEEHKDWRDPQAHVPELEPIAAPDAWRAEDALVVPLQQSDGHPLGILSVDEPLSGRRPSDDDLAVLAAVAGHVASAIEDARSAAAAAGVRAALEQLLEVSSRLTDLTEKSSLLDAIAVGIQRALGFEKVAVAIADGRGRFVPRGSAGWQSGAPELDFTHTLEDIEALIDDRFEVEGCYLLPRAEALARSSVGSTHASQRNGRGPHAWNRHWLIVPLHDRAGGIAGFVWADDPEDCLLPSRERLAALRTFANQASAALHASLDFETLARRNRELAALHQTTIALLDRLDLDAVLEAIVDNARSLVGIRNAYLYLVDEEAEELRLRVRLGVFVQAAGIPLRRGEGLAGRVWESGRSLAVDDYATWSGNFSPHRWSGLHSTLGVPLRTGDTVRGVLGVASDDPEREFGSTEIALLERFAQLASLALENARLFEEARRSAELYRRVVEGSSDSIALLDLDGRILFAAPSLERVLGHPVEALVGTALTEHVHPDDLATVHEAFAASERGAPQTPTVARARHADGHYVTLEGVPSPIHDEAGNVEFFVAVVRDITGRIREEEERLRLEERLRQAQKMESIGLLAGGIAHDFNNLLTAIGGYAELSLLELADEHAARGSIEQIARAADRAASLTSQLLAFSRKQILRPSALDLNEVVGQMATMLARMLGDDVVLSTALEPQLAPVRADPTQVEQVVLNLAINARDAMPTGGKLLLRTGELDVADAESSPHPDLAPGSYVTLSVEDTGVGMETELAERIFEPFFTTKGVGEGTGLGLATVHGIVSQSGGAIWVASEPGSGSRFTVCLPRAQAVEPAGQPPLAAQRR
jgi:PAS domain S-box-containing protein